MLILTLSLIVLFVAIYKRQQRLSIFKRLRIPGPTPNFIFGNLLDIGREGLHLLFPKWTKQFGPIVGFFFGGRPQIMITDLELIRRVLVKDFHKFSDRSQCIPGGVHPVPVLQNMIAWCNYSSWKNLRASMSPSFSSSKLAAMEPLMIASIDKLVSELDDKADSGEEFNLRSYIYELTFSTGSKSVFGLDLSLKQLTNEVKGFLEVSTPRLDRSILAMTMMLFPSLSFIAYPLRIWWERFRFYMLWSPEGLCYDVTNKIVQNRKAAPVQSADFLHLLMNTKRVQTSGVTDLEMSSEDAKSSNRVMDKQLHTENISDDEIVTNAMILLIGSYETTSITLQFCLHNLVQHQSIQDELRSQLRKTVGKGSVSFSTLSDVPLLNHIIKETLRMFPPISPFLTRVANENYEYEGIVIPRGMPVFIGVSSIHNDPKLWPDPETFRPERFESTFDKLAYLSFGAGPKNCIGMRFAYMEIQLALAKLILKYRFEPGPSSEKKIETAEVFASLAPKNGVFCKITRLEE
jgi:cytochrome P450